METVSTEGLKEKTSREVSPVNSAIRLVLSSLQQGQAIKMKELAQELSDKTGVKREQIYVRIGTILKSKKFVYLKKFVNAERDTLIGR